MLFAAFGWLVWCLWAVLLLGAVLNDDTPTRARVTVGLMALVGASWTLWAIFQG